jgi:hypothetical protein
VLWLMEEVTIAERFRREVCVGCSSEVNEEWLGLWSSMWKEKDGADLRGNNLQQMGWTRAGMDIETKYETMDRHPLLQQIAPFSLHWSQIATICSNF